MPVVPRIVADDVTPEAAATLLAEQGGRLAVISAEGGIFDVIAGRYSSSVPNLDVWLKGHSGDSLRVDRKGRPSEYVRRPALTLGLMIQPAVLTAIARHETFRGRGLLARFLYAVPPSRGGHRQVGMPPVPEPVAAAWDTLVRDLAVTLAGWHDPAVVVLDPAAAELAIEMEAALEPELGPRGTLEHLADWGSKLTGATLRIACLLHLDDDPQGSWRLPIGVDTLRRAGRLADYYRAHPLVAFDAMRADPTVADAEHLLEMIRRIGRPVVSTRDVFTVASRSRFPKVGDLEPPLAMLDDHGYISAAAQPERAEKRGCKPSPLWAVSPHVVPAQTTETTERKGQT